MPIHLTTLDPISCKVGCLRGDNPHRACISSAVVERMEYSFADTLLNFSNAVLLPTSTVCRLRLPPGGLDIEKSSAAGLRTKVDVVLFFDDLRDSMPEWSHGLLLSLLPCPEQHPILQGISEQAPWVS
jgi:hypothetical protein